MSTAIPFLTSYDPPGTSEGTLDPLGLYQIADQLAVRLVPAVRERMQRVRFLTAVAVGSLVTEGLEPDPEQPETPPFLVWEWLVVEAMIRSMGDDGVLWGVPGTLVTRRALNRHGYLDHRSYLKTPRIFGFHGVYKRLATHIGLVDTHLAALPEGEQLVDAWAKDAGYGGIDGIRPMLDSWRSAVDRSLSQQPARTRPRWSQEDWDELACMLAPHRPKRREKRLLRELLHGGDDRALGALPAIWRLQDDFGQDDYVEETLHERLGTEKPKYGALLDAIRVYEGFARALTDAFDIMRAEAGEADARGLEPASLAAERDVRLALANLDDRFESARQRLGDIDLQLANLFEDRFAAFAQPMEVGDRLLQICDHHESIQKDKSADGKRPWFDRLSPTRIYVRHRYRVARPDITPDQYVHDFRGMPVRNFYFDLK